ncbi:hypothetical protein BsWGS_24644 [Bradybaena similaris]
MEKIYVLAIVFAFSCLSSGTDEILCSKGEHLHTPREGHDICRMCDPGTFMDEENHSLRTCKPCRKIENSEVEVLVSACNRTHDAEILCTSGYYRYRARNARQKDHCEKCTECLLPTRACEGYNNTVCCPPNHDAVMYPSGVFVCKERPVVCGPEKFFNPHTEECTPCPVGTYMSAHNHRYHQCLKCEELSGNNDNHAVIIRPCSRTAPTLFGCEKGYFRDPTQESTQIEVPCTRCGNCRLAECSMFQGCKGDETQIENMQAANAKSDGDNPISEQKNDTEKLPTILNDESNFQTDKNDTELHIFNESRGFDYVWVLHLIFDFVLLCDILLLLLCRENNVMAYHKSNTCHCCNQPVTIRQFTLIGLIVLCIVFQISVAVVKWCAINPTAAECTLMSLSIVNVVFCNVIFYKYYRTSRETRRTHLQNVLQITYEECLIRKKDGPSFETKHLQNILTPKEGEFNLIANNVDL